MNYEKYNNTKQRAVNNFLPHDIFFAFSDDQFREGVEKIHAKKSHRGKWLISKIPGGGFINNSAIASWIAFWDNWERYDKIMQQSDEFVIEGLIYEYRNHEAQLDSYGDSKATAEEIFPYATDKQKKTAWKKFWNMCVENDWF